MFYISRLLLMFLLIDITCGNRLCLTWNVGKGSNKLSLICRLTDVLRPTYYFSNPYGITQAICKSTLNGVTCSVSNEHYSIYFDKSKYEMTLNISKMENNLNGQWTCGDGLVNSTTLVNTSAGILSSTEVYLDGYYQDSTTDPIIILECFSCREPYWNDAEFLVNYSTIDNIRYSKELRKCFNVEGECKQDYCSCSPSGNKFTRLIRLSEFNDVKVFSCGMKFTDNINLMKFALYSTKVFNGNDFGNGSTERVILRAAANIINNINNDENWKNTVFTLIVTLQTIVLVPIGLIIFCNRNAKRKGKLSEEHLKLTLHKRRDSPFVSEEHLKLTLHKRRDSPFGTMVVSKDFDHILMIYLLRHLSSITLLSSVYDNVPSNSGRSIGTILARIKNHRNRIVHNTGRSIDNFEIKTFLEDLLKAISKLHEEKYEQQCASLLATNIEHCFMDIMDIYKECLTADASQLEEQTDIEEQLRDPVPKNERENINVIIQQWKQKDKQFVETNGYKSLERTLETESVAIVTGSPGSGKSCTAQHALISLGREGYDILPLRSSADMVRYFSRQHKQAFYIDNLCGRYNISSSDIEEWDQNRKKISEILMFRSTKCIFTCRLQICKDENFSNLNLHEVKIIDLSSTHQVTLNEKKSIGEFYLQKDTLTGLKDDTITESECFPLLCSLYDKHSHKPFLFFEMPKNYFFGELDELKMQQDELKYACIALCVIFNDDVGKDIFSHSVDITKSKRLEAVLEECKIYKSSTREEIKSQFDSMVGSYFQTSKDGYRSIHDYMFDIYCSHVSKHMLGCILEHSVSSLLRDRVLLHGVDETSDQFSIVVPPNMETRFWRRILEDINNCKIWDVYASQQMKYVTYRSKLHTQLLQREKIVNNTDENGVTALMVVSYLGYSDFVLSLSSMGNVNQRDKKGSTPLHFASGKGNKECVNVLINQGAGVNICDIDGHTPLLMASERGHSDIVEFLCIGGDVDKSDRKGSTPLWVASLNGHIACVNVLLSNGAGINICGFQGQIPLHAASSKGHAEIVEMLCSRGGNIDYSDINGYTPLHIASYEGHESCVDILLNKGAEANKGNGKERTPLYLAAWAGHAQVVKMLCSRGGHVDQSDINGCTPLHIASYEGHASCVNILLNKGARVNAYQNQGLTPLHIASQRGHADVVEILCIKGAHVDQSDSNGCTPLHHASYTGYKTCIEVLLNRAATLNICNNMGITPLYIASLVGHVEVVEMLCNRGGNIDQSDEHGFTPLHIASYKGQKECVDVLLNNGAAVNTTSDNLGKSPLHLASDNGHAKVVEMLCNRGGMVDQIDFIGNTPLHAASYKGHTTCVDILLKKGAGANICDNQGRTPLCLAAQAGHPPVVSMLCSRGGNINQCDEDGRTPLFYASNKRYETHASEKQDRGAYASLSELKSIPLDIAPEPKKGYDEVVDTLYTRNVNTSDGEGNTQLYTTSYFEIDKCVDVLLQNGADVNLCNINGVTPLHAASEKGLNGIVDILCKRKGNVNRCDKFGRTPLYSASFKGHENCVHILIKRGARVNLCNYMGGAPLHVASQENHCNIVDMLCKSGGNVNRRTKDGRTPLYIAAQKGNTNIVDMLCERRGKVNRRTKDGRSPLYVAALKGHKKCVILLLNRGAEVDTFDTKKHSPVYAASKKGHRDIVNMLCKRGANIHHIVQMLLTRERKLKNGRQID